MSCSPARCSCSPSSSSRSSTPCPSPSPTTAMRTGAARRRRHWPSRAPRCSSSRTPRPTSCPSPPRAIRPPATSSSCSPTATRRRTSSARPTGSRRSPRPTSRSARPGASPRSAAPPSAPSARPPPGTPRSPRSACSPTTAPSATRACPRPSRERPSGPTTPGATASPTPRPARCGTRTTRSATSSTRTATTWPRAGGAGWASATAAPGARCAPRAPPGQVGNADDEVGYFVDENGDNLAQGWRVGVGFDNFAAVVTNPTISQYFFEILAWNLGFAVLSVLVTFAAGLFMAVVLNHPKLRGQRVYRSLLILPYAMPAFAMLLVWRDMFNTDFGLINNLLGLQVNWLGDEWTARFAVLLVQLWMGYPYMFLVATGALQAIPADLSEAAGVDGAKPGYAFRTITFPLLLVALSPLLITSFAFNFNNFNAIYLVTEGGPFPPDHAGAAGAGGDHLVRVQLQQLQRDLPRGRGRTVPGGQPAGRRHRPAHHLHLPAGVRRGRSTVRGRRGALRAHLRPRSRHA